MYALSYLLAARLKNTVRDLLRHPGRLLYVVILVLLFLFAAVGSSGLASDHVRDLHELAAMGNGLFLLVFLLGLWNGFAKGGSVFSMADVNLLFPSPIRRTQALFYALLRQMSTTLLVGLVLLYQYGWLHSSYHISVLGMAAVCLGYVLALFLGQVTAMTLYTYTSNRPGAQKVLQGVLILCLLALAGWVCLGGWQSPQDRLAGLVNAANGWPVKLFPVGGWLGWSFAGVLGLDRWWPGLALCAVWLAVMVVLLVRFPGDWYEDVLRTAELAQSAIAAKKEGNLDAAPGKIRLGKTGLGKGWGASAFYYKQKREDTRGGWLLLSPASLAFAGVVIVLAVLWRSAGLLTLFGLSVYLQIFSTGQNRLSRELGKPFLYLVPEPAFAKLLQCLRALLPSAGMEAVVTFVPVCLLLGLGPGSMLACVFSRLTYALLFQSGDLLVEVSIRSHPFFQRDGANVLCELPITFTQAALGAELEVPTLDGKVRYTIPEGTQTGTVFRLRGKGIPFVHSKTRGDQLVTVVVETPTKLSREQKELLRRFGESTRDAGVQPKNARFFEKLKQYFDK